MKRRALSFGFCLTTLTIALSAIAGGDAKGSSDDSWGLRQKTIHSQDTASFSAKESTAPEPACVSPVAGVAAGCSPNSR